MLSLSHETKANKGEAFYSTSRNLDDLLNIDISSGSLLYIVCMCDITDFMLNASSEILYK